MTTAVEAVNGAVPTGRELTEFARQQVELVTAQETRLAQVSEQVESEGLTVAGSTGQRRANPLLPELRALEQSVSSKTEDLVTAVSKPKLMGDKFTRRIA